MKKIGIGIVGFIIVIQFIRPTKNLGSLESASDISKVVQVPENVISILKSSCYDCHSNSSNYLWYSEIMPVGWFLNHHIEEGKEHLNFSEFGAYSKEKQDHKLEECIEEVQEHEMPLSSYLLTHSEAKLTDEQIQLLNNWFVKARAELK